LRRDAPPVPDHDGLPRPPTGGSGPRGHPPVPARPHRRGLPDDPRRDGTEDGDRSVSGFVIGCDVGSQGTNGALYADDGTLVSSAYEAYDLSFPHPSWAEQDPDVWTAAVEGVCRRLGDSCPGGADGIGGLSFGSQLDGMVACDADGRPVRPAMIWMDRRAEPQAARLAERISRADFYAAVGANLDSSHAIFKALWIRDEEPASWERVV